MKATYTLTSLNERYSVSPVVTPVTTWEFIKAITMLIGFSALGALSLTPLLMFLKEL